MVPALGDTDLSWGRAQALPQCPLPEHLGDSDEGFERETCETSTMNAHVTLGGAMSGEYLIDEVLEDGRVVLRPDTSAEAINRRLGVRPISGDEFADFLAENPDMLPADDEG